MYIKGFDENLQCRGYQFEVGKEDKIEHKGKPAECCTNTVFHFCDSLQDVHKYYSVEDEEKNRFCEIEPLGEIVQQDNKLGCDHIKIVREITGKELDILKGKINGNTGIFNTGTCNTGDYNSGDYNTGDNNTGDYNSGDCNTGNWNTGKYNTGHWNTGDYNTGDYNSGDCNTGDWNTGNWNTGNCNTGDWNSCSHETGMFNTKSTTLRFFNKPSDWTYEDWNRSKAKSILRTMPYSGKKLRWVDKSKMTEEEENENPTYKTCGGYLKTETIEANVQEWWNELSEEKKQEIFHLPNFDAEIFKSITGIAVKEDK